MTFFSLISMPFVLCGSSRIFLLFAEEHEKLVEAYSALDQKLQNTLSGHSALEITIQELKVCPVVCFEMV